MLHRLAAHLNTKPRPAMVWLYYATLVALNLAAGYALGRWWLKNRASASGK